MMRHNGRSTNGKETRRRHATGGASLRALSESVTQCTDRGRTSKRIDREGRLGKRKSPEKEGDIDASTEELVVSRPARFRFPTHTPDELN